MESEPTVERRRFIRHPTTIPIKCYREGHLRRTDTRLRDISHGGLSFASGEGFEPGDVLKVEFPSLRNSPTVRGEVVWTMAVSDKADPHYFEGLRFLDEDTYMRARVVEEICHIEAYRESQLQHHGRSLTSQEAAGEWIQRFAHKFPR